MKNESTERIVAVRAKRRGLRTWLVTINYRAADGRVAVARGTGLSEGSAVRAARRAMLARERAAA